MCVSGHDCFIGLLFKKVARREIDLGFEGEEM